MAVVLGWYGISGICYMTEPAAETLIERAEEGAACERK